MVENERIPAKLAKFLYSKKEIAIFYPRFEYHRYLINNDTIKLVPRLFKRRKKWTRLYKTARRRFYQYPSRKYLCSL